MKKFFLFIALLLLCNNLSSQDEECTCSVQVDVHSRIDYNWCKSTEGGFGSAAYTRGGKVIHEYEIEVYEIPCLYNNNK